MADGYRWQQVDGGLLKNWNEKILANVEFLSNDYLDITS